jgi:hypothetical protein
MGNCFSKSSVPPIYRQVRYKNDHRSIVSSGYPQSSYNAAHPRDRDTRLIPEYIEYSDATVVPAVISTFDDPRYVYPTRPGLVFTLISRQRSFDSGTQDGRYEYAPEHHRRSSHSRSVSAPVNPIGGFHHNSAGSAALYAQLPEHVRQHPRFQEGARAAEMVGRYGQDDARADLYRRVLREVIEEINDDEEEEWAVRESLGR